MKYATPTTEYSDPHYGAKSAQASAGQGILGKSNGPLIEAAIRIERAIEVAQQLGSKVSGHADRVFGPVPEQDCVEGPLSTDHGGAIGNLFSALDRLDAVQSYLVRQCDRNSGLA